MYNCLNEGQGGKKIIHKFTSLCNLAFSLSTPPIFCTGQSIKELYVKLDLIINGKTVLSYSETLCGPGITKLIFCGKKKGGNLGSTLKCLMATEYCKQYAPTVLLNAPIYCNVMFISTAC